MNFPIHSFSSKEVSWSPADALNTLYIQGTEVALQLLKKIPENGLAVVGTRNPQTRSVDLVKKTIHSLRGSGLTIISGMARGIDAAAHGAALDSGLPTIAILGSGLDSGYPRENLHLKEKILHHHGLIISEYPLGTPALAHHFLRRNRIIAGLSHATWIVEAGFRSGALNTARWAREYDRTCYAVPCYPNDPAFQGNQTLIDRDHAIPFWGAHSLGATWIQLAAQPPLENQRVSSFQELPELVKFVNLLTHQKGGASLDEVLNWVHSQNWETADFFAALRSAIEQKVIFEHRGVLISR